MVWQHAQAYAHMDAVIAAQKIAPDSAIVPVKTHVVAV